MGDIIGTFYFKRTKTGNLIGEYSNCGMITVDAEVANVIKSENVGFIGEYNCVFEEDDGCQTVTLHIKLKYKDNNKIYSLKWSKNNKTIHWGEGILVDDMLIGNYRSFESKTNGISIRKN